MYHAPKINPVKQPTAAPAVHNRTAAARTPPKPATPKVAKTSASKTPRAAKSSTAAPATIGLREWARRMDEFALDHDRIIRSYSMRETFAVNEPIQHPKFGKGVVLEIVDEHKIAILFEEGRKVLAMGSAPVANAS
jgi:hypothetical protein